MKLDLGILSNTWCAQIFLKRTKPCDNLEILKNYMNNSHKNSKKTNQSSKKKKIRLEIPTTQTKALETQKYKSKNQTSKSKSK
jgi:hypothetical protein